MRVEEIKKRIDEEFGIDISIKCRQTPYIMARALYYHFAMRFGTNSHSLVKVAEVVNKDHASLINGKKTHESYMFSDETYRYRHSKLEEFFRSHAPEETKDVLYRIGSYSKTELENDYRRLNSKYRNLQNQYNKLKRVNRDLKNMYKTIDNK